MPLNSEIFLTSAKSAPSPLKRPDSQQPFRVLVIGNISGGNRQWFASDADNNPIVNIDVDNFEQVLARIKPNLQLSLDDSLPNICIEFEDLEDFHPDNVFKKIDIFSQFARIREKLLNPATVKEGAAELQAILNLSRVEQQADSSVSAVDIEDDEQTLDRLLGESPTRSAQSKPASGEEIALAYIKQVVAEHIVEDVSPFQDIYIKAVDDAISVLMCKLLHHPDFQALEAAWRSLHMLVTGLETDETLSVHLFDISKEQLCQDLLAESNDLLTTQLYRQLVTQTVNSYGGEPWSLLIGNYTFSHDDNDLALLAALGCLASHAGAPFIAAADPTLLGCNVWQEQSDQLDWTISDSQANEKWQKLRLSGVASWIGLTFPRILLRLPYGANTDPIDSFEFEEMALETEHESFLWSNAAFHCALLIGQTFCEQGWDMHVGDYLELSDLPAYVDPASDERRLKPCAEVCLSDRAMEKILSAGIMPFISHRNLNVVRLPRFQSIADPLQNLKAAWN